MEKLPEADFLKHLDGILDNSEALDMDTALQEIPEWDSLALVSVVLLAKHTTGKSLTVDDLQGCDTVRDVYHLVADAPA